MRNWILVAIAAVFATLFLVVMGNLFYVPGSVMLVIAVSLFLLGLALVILTIRSDETGKLRFMLILTGASAVAIPLTAVLHNFVLHAFFFILALFVLPLAFVIAWVASAAMILMADKPGTGTRNLFVGTLSALVLACGAPIFLSLGESGYDVTSELVGAPPEELNRVFVITEVDEALMHVVYHSFEHSLVSALESNGISAAVVRGFVDPENTYANETERQTFAPVAMMHIRLDPLYRTHREGSEVIVGTVFEVGLSHADSGQELWRLSGKVDYVADRFFDRPGFETSHGMKKEFAWHTTAAIGRTFMNDVLDRESEPVYTVTERRERKGQRTD